MRQFVAGLAVLVVAWACKVASAQPLIGMETSVAADTLRVRVYFHLPAGVDSAKFVVSVSGQQNQTQTTAVASGSLLFNFVKPAEGQTVTINVSPTAYKLGQAFVQQSATKTYTSPVGAPGNVLDSIQVAVLDGIDAGPLYVVNSSSDTVYRGRWIWWGDALLHSPARLGDTVEFRREAANFAASPRYRNWWAQVKACDGCLVLLPIDSTVPGVKL